MDVPWFLNPERRDRYLHGVFKLLIITMIDDSFMPLLWSKIK